MNQSQRQRFGPTDAHLAGKGQPARSPHGVQLLLLSALAAVLSGCAGDGQVTDPLASLGNPFQRPTESGFRSMVQANCSQKSVGNTTVSALLGQNSAFDGSITALYNGDISNDEFMNQVLLQYPAPDANVPATGCIMNQLEQCFAETCKVQTASERQKTARANAEEIEEIDTAVTIDPNQLPAQDTADVNRMIDASTADDPKPLP
jgi:hypothetical protein